VPWCALTALVAALAGCTVPARTVPDDEAAGAQAAARSTPMSGTRDFDAALVARGEWLARIGDCHGCHTAAAGPSYAGGRALPTPFGVVYGTNITPDPETGIGRWTRRDFDRAMREGVDARGRHLYPVFPYDHFRHLADEDLRALYAYLMTREPVRATPPPNDLRFPFNARPLIAVWKALYLRGIVLPSDPARGDAWNRGAYLVASLGHCGACHTPRNAWGAEDARRTLAGGDVEGWHAPALDATSPSPTPWNVAALATYLRDGIAPRHSIAAGPMAAVPRALEHVPTREVQAMATYLVALQREDDAVQMPATHDDAARASHESAAAGEPRGAALYAAACGTCHDAGRVAWPEGALQPEQWIAATIPTPANLVHIIVDGVHPAPGERGRWMPAFGGAFGAAQLVDLAAYVRARAGQPPWRDAAAQVDDALATRGREP
jgi:mono/diheme cytochrome c family protein